MLIIMLCMIYHQRQACFALLELRLVINASTAVSHYLVAMLAISVL